MKKCIIFLSYSVNEFYKIFVKIYVFLNFLKKLILCEIIFAHLELN